MFGGVDKKKPRRKEVVHVYSYNMEYVFTYLILLFRLEIQRQQQQKVLQILVVILHQHATWNSTSLTVQRQIHIEIFKISSFFLLCSFDIPEIMIFCFAYNVSFHFIFVKCLEPRKFPTYLKPHLGAEFFFLFFMNPVSKCNHNSWCMFSKSTQIMIELV